MANNNSDVEVKFGGDAGEAIEETRRLADTVKNALGSLNSDMGASSVAAYAFGEVIGNVMMNVASKIGDMVKHAITAYGELGDSVEAAQRRIGGSAEYVSGMKVALESVGLSMQQFQNTSQRLGQILISNGDRIKEAGIEYLDMNGKLLDSGTIIQNISAHLEQFTAGAARNTEGARLLGRSYRELADYVELTKERIAEAKQVSEEFGLVMTDRDIEATNEFHRQVSLLSSAMEGFFVMVGKALTPALTSLAAAMRDGASPAFLIFKGVVVTIMAILEGLVWGIHLLWEVLGSLTDTLHFAASALEAVGYAMSFQFAKAAEVGKKAWEDYSASVASRASSILSHAAHIKSRMDALISTPAAGAAPEGSGDDPAKHKGGDPVGQAQAAAKLALIKQQLAEELAALSSGHKDMLDETESFYDKKLSITLRGLNAEKEKLATDLKAIESEHQVGESKERTAQIEAKSLGIKGQVAVLDRRIADAVLSNEREKTEAVQQETVKRVDLEERAQMRAFASTQNIAKDTLAFQRNLGQITQSEELVSLAALEAARFAAERESLERRMSLQREGSMKQKELQGQILALIAEHERQVIRSEEQITQATVREYRQRVTAAADAKLQIEKIELGAKQDLLSYKRSIDEIGAEDELKEAKKLAQSKYELEARALAEKRSLYAVDSAEYRDLTAQMEITAAQHSRTMLQIDHRMQQQKVSDAVNAQRAIQHDFQSTLSEMMQGSMTWQKGLQTMWKSLTKAFSDFVSKQVTDWLFGEQRKTGISKLWSEVRKLLYPEEAQAEMTSKGTATAATNAMATESATTAITAKATEATAVVSSNAAEAASGAAASASSIPMVGWAMAAGVFAAVLAMVLGAQSNIKSAEGGFDIPSGMNPMVQLHEEEMVLPREHAETIRNLNEQGGSARSRGGDNITITAMDSRSMRDALKRQYKSLTPSLQKLARGNFQKVRR